MRLSVLRRGWKHALCAGQCRMSYEMRHLSGLVIVISDTSVGVLLPRPRRIIRTSQPRTVEYGLISSCAMDYIPLPSLRLQQATRMSLALPGEDCSIIGKESSCLCQEEIRLPLEALLYCEPARVKMPCGRETCVRIKIFRLMDLGIYKFRW